MRYNHHASPLDAPCPVNARGIIMSVRQRTREPGVNGRAALRQQTSRQYKILMIAPTSFFSDYGCSVRILEEVGILQQLGNQVTVCTYRNGQDKPGLTIRRTPSIPFREHYEVGSSPHKIAFDFLLFWTVLFTALRSHPDVIHAHMHEGALIGLVVSRLLRVPLLFDFQGSLTGEMVDHQFLRKDSFIYRPLRWLERQIDHLAPVILTSSHNAKQALIEDFDCQPDKVHPVADCVDSRKFFPPSEGEQPSLAKRRDTLEIPPGRKLVVYLGLLADYQGTNLLLQAAARLLKQRADVHFLIMGFPAVEHYQHMAHQLGIAAHTTFTGKVPYHQARDYLALGDVAVAPKLSATEGSGKILNYMAMGLPTVAFDTPVSREYLGDAGIYATPGDPASLAEALLCALSENSNLDRSLELRRTALQSYSWDRAADVILRAYGSVCHRQATVL
jgi:glycosyltransferase involved in cell wall biosynthesis